MGIDMNTRTVAKISILGTGYLADLADEIPIESIPECIGGKCPGGNETFHFDLREGGPLHYPGAPTTETDTYSEAKSSKRQGDLSKAPLHVTNGSALNETVKLIVAAGLTSVLAFAVTLIGFGIFDRDDDKNPAQPLITALEALGVHLKRRLFRFY
jgi:hypothetical protein